jgi:hypothetical protein
VKKVSESVTMKRIKIKLFIADRVAFNEKCFFLYNKSIFVVMNAFFLTDYRREKTIKQNYLE